MAEVEDNTVELDFKYLNEEFLRIRNLQKLHKMKEKDDDEDNNSSEELKKLINEVGHKIDEMLTRDNGCKFRLLAMKTTLLYERSKILSSTQEVEEAKELLDKCLNDISECTSTPEMIFLTLRIVNHFAYLLSKAEDYNKALAILQLGESIYDKAKQDSTPITFFTSDDLFSPSKASAPAAESSKKLEHLVTSNIQMLAFVYSKLELHDKFAAYHHEALDRQLQMGDDDILMWSVKATSLASYLLDKKRFEEARHHLAAAVYVLYEQEKELNVAEPSDTIAERWRELQNKFADAANVYVKYGLALFNSSKTKAVGKLCHDSSEALGSLWCPPFPSHHPSHTDQVQKKESQDKLSSSLPSSPGAPGGKLFFKSLNLLELESQVSASLVETTAQARALFHHTHAWLKKVKLFYTLQDYPMEYVNAILDLSELYKHLAFYEEDIEGQYAVQKLRADALETLSTVLREIRPQCYLAVTVELLRELAEIQLEMMGLNLRRIYAAQTIPETGQFTIHKMDALSGLHSKLQQFGANTYTTENS